MVCKGNKGNTKGMFIIALFLALPYLLLKQKRVSVYLLIIALVVYYLYIPFFTQTHFGVYGAGWQILSRL